MQCAAHICPASDVSATIFQETGGNARHVFSRKINSDKRPLVCLEQDADTGDGRRVAEPRDQVTQEKLQKPE